MTFLMLLLILCSVIFMFLNHPMTMGFTLLIQTIIISLINSLLNLNFWFSYILFLIMVGGMLVLFIYMTSIASNEMFSFSNKLLLLIILPILLNLLFMFMDKYYTLININFMENFLYNSMSMNKFFNYPSFIIVMMMIIYLFITLIAVVKITNMKFGPLRQNN